MDKNLLKGIAERKLEHMRRGLWKGSLDHFVSTGVINGSFLDALNDLVDEIVSSKKLNEAAVSKEVLIDFIKFVNKDDTILTWSTEIILSEFEKSIKQRSGINT